MAGLVECKFFARGTCRYGESCKFYHNRGDASGSFNYGGNNYNNSILSPSNFRPQGQNQQQHHQQHQQHQQQQNFRQVGFSNKTMETLTHLEEATIKDMKEWESSQMWPLSVYAPVSQKACLPGFEDYSPEELRYSWLQHGRQPPPDLMARIQRVNDLRSAYQKSGNTRAVLDRLIKGATTEQIASEFNLPTSSTMAGTNWGAPVANPIATPGFNMMNQAPKLQVGLQNSPLNLGNSSSLGGGGLWGQPQTNLPAPSFTGQSNVNSIFAPSMTTTIGDTMDASELSAAMAQQSQQSNNQMLNPGFGNFQPQSNQLPPEKKFSFQLDNNSGATNINPNPAIGSASPFGIPFTGAQQSAPNIFGGSTLPQNVSVNPNIQASQQIQPSVAIFVYSEEADLTDEDKVRFMADEFDVVPLKPPARSYCL